MQPARNSALHKVAEHLCTPFATGRASAAALAVFLLLTYSLMETVLSTFSPPLAFSPASSSSSSTSPDLGFAHPGRWRGLESSSSSCFAPSDGAQQLRAFQFAAANSPRRSASAWSQIRVRCDVGLEVVHERVGEDERWRLTQDFTTVMKFGGSSVASAHRMKEVAQLILSFPEERPVIVLSAMGKTTNNLLKVCILRVLVRSGQE